MKRFLLALTMVAIAAPAGAFSFFSIGATSGPAPGDPGLASFETSLVTFDAPLHAGTTDTTSGPVALHTGTSGIAAAPAGDHGVYQALGAGGSSLFDFTGYVAGRNIRSLSVYVGSVDSYNSIDVLDRNLHVIGTITGSQLPGSNGDQGASITNRRLYINFAPGENVGGLDFRSSGIAFEFDTIGASSAVFRNTPSGSTPAVLPPAVVPEPAAWSLMISGFAMIGLAARRRRVALSI